MSKKYLFERIANEIEHKIKLGEYKAGMLIPSEKKLQDLYGVSRTTIRKALQQLVNQDLIIKKNGVGIYIKPKITSQNILQMTGVMKNKALGDSKKIVKEFCLRKAGPYYSQIFEISVNTLLYSIKAVQKKNSSLVLETILLPLDLYPFLVTGDLQMVNTIELLSSSQEKLYEMQQELQLISAGDLQKRYMKVKPATPIFKLSSQYYAESGRIIGVSDRYETAATTKFEIDFN